MMHLTVIGTLLLTLAHAPAPTIGYGFDGGAPSAAACPPKASRRGRAQLLAAIPCDLNEQTFCNQPGTQYPWHAVRRFVHENQGLMKRMYGDVKHIAVLRGEMDRDNNEIGADDVAETRARYSRAGGKKNKYLYTDYNYKANDVLTEPYFRPQTSTTTTSTTTKTTTTTTTEAPVTVVASDSTTILAKQSVTAKPAPSTTNTRTTTTLKSSSSFVYENITLPVAFSTLNRNQSEAQPLQLDQPATISTTLRIFAPAKISVAESAAITPPHDDYDDDDIRSADAPTSPSSIAASSTETITASSTVIGGHDDVTLSAESLDSISKETTAKRGRPPLAEGGAQALEGQFFQNIVPKEASGGQSGGGAAVVPPPNARGVNACPVKEEVVAPFWANNTRGEVLALLNLYPFEQYVHWEKCTNELKQMWCRDGCRCEQQFRLHRLLAYDPHNECRGIFSDWFRFPSCCICKCYDIPLEYRMTSRSPRDMMTEEPERPATFGRSLHPVDVAQEAVKRAAYEHVVGAESWYQRRRALSVEAIDYGEEADNEEVVEE